MKKKSGRVSFVVLLLMVIAVLGAVLLGGYFVLNNVIVPQYFSSYGIKNMPDLVGMIRTLYSIPSEHEIVTNSYSKGDLSTAINKLTESGYSILSDGTFDFEAFEQGKRGSGGIYLTDRELCAIVDKLLDSTEFSDILPNLNYIDTINMSLLELTILPDTIQDDQLDTNNAHIEFIVKVDTTEVRSQMAKEMDIPVFLLNMIFPETLYLTANYNVNIDNSGSTSVWTTSNGTLSVNGSNDKQSEILLELLISFIFNEEDNMTIEKLVTNFGYILEQGVELFGEIEFAGGLGLTKDQYGIYFLPVE